MKTREPSVAGKFYPASPDKLKALIGKIHTAEKENIALRLASKKIVGGVVPHAGYIYSGYQAVHFFDILKHTKPDFDTIVIINPNHTGYGESISLDGHGKWSTPLGEVNVDLEFCSTLELPTSDMAHLYEHSGEVMLPFLQYFLDYEFKIAPITILDQTVGNAKLLADKLLNAKKELNRNICVIASSDFSHFVEPELGDKLDDMVIKEIESLNSVGIFETVTKNQISVCGYCPIMTLVEYCHMLDGEISIELLRRGNSGDVAPSDQVVDYVSMLFYQ